jgi:hypothetical protein
MEHVVMVMQSPAAEPFSPPNLPLSASHTSSHRAAYTSLVYMYVCIFIFGQSPNAPMLQLLYCSQPRNTSQDNKLKTLLNKGKGTPRMSLEAWHCTALHYGHDRSINTTPPRVQLSQVRMRSLFYFPLLQSQAVAELLGPVKLYYFLTSTQATATSVKAHFIIHFVGFTARY